jgi:starch phosphorylase
MTDAARDPVCGMPVDPASGRSAGYQGRTFFFCSEYCKNFFLAHPERFGGEPPAGGASEEPASRRLAYFSMEVGLDDRLPTYSGGLGVLAGDMLASFADLKLPVVGVTLLYAKGYFRQTIDAEGNQRESAVEWDPMAVVRPLPAVVSVTIANRSVAIRACQWDVKGSSGYTVPLLLLDTNIPENSPADRELTAVLYGGDERYRLSQEIVLGIGGVRMLRALGYTGVRRFHMNEGHASLLALELLRSEPNPDDVTRDIEDVRRRCVFTTHTPVPAGHDQFSYELVKEVLGEPLPAEEIRMLGGEDRLNMTRLALNLSHYVNGVAKRHGEVTQEMFPGYAIDSITNGVHSFSWTCDSFRRLFDRRIPGWAHDPFSLRHAIKIPKEEVWAAHVEAKEKLFEEIRSRTDRPFSRDIFTIGFARRATTYKRADLIFSDMGRLSEIARRTGSLQLVFAGKAHPKDDPGKEIIRRIVRFSREAPHELRIVYLEGHDLKLARLLTSGVDLWLNTPLPPLEASGTSGMKAAHNGVPSLSVLDGCWVEGHIEGITGWSIGPPPGSGARPEEEKNKRDAAELYEKLSQTIIPLYYFNRDAWTEIMRRAIAFNASFFNTHRMVQQYASTAYLKERGGSYGTGKKPGPPP